MVGWNTFPFSLKIVATRSPFKGGAGRHGVWNTLELKMFDSSLGWVAFLGAQLWFVNPEGAANVTTSCHGSHMPHGAMDQRETFCGGDSHPLPTNPEPKKHMSMSNWTSIGWTWQGHRRSFCRSQVLISPFWQKVLWTSGLAYGSLGQHPSFAQVGLWGWSVHLQGLFRGCSVYSSWSKMGRVWCRFPINQTTLVDKYININIYNIDIYIYTHETDRYRYKDEYRYTYK